MAKDIKLKVMEALQEEAYKGIVRIDAETMHQLSVHPGDVVEIEGARKTVGIVDRAYPTDIGQSIIRMDGILRRNAKTGIGENIIVRKALVKEAKSITIAPAQKGITIKADPFLFKRGLIGRAVVKGDIIVPGSSLKRRSSLSDSPFFDDVFNILEEGFSASFPLSGLRFIVANTSPLKEPLIITENTSLTIAPKAVDISEEKVPEVTYEDIGGLSEEVQKIREMVEIPLKHPQLFAKLGIEPPRGVLLHGPPGTGKTLLAKAVANESEANFILINGPEIINKFYGESEKRVREIFEEAEKNAPSIIFIDEIDAIASKREESFGELERRVVSQLLTALDGLKGRGNVVVIGATNRPNSIDPALRRPGRFDREIAIGVPDKNARLNILKIHTRNMPLVTKENIIELKKRSKDFSNKSIVELDELARITHGFVGADLSALCRESAMNVLRRILPDIKFGEKDEVPKKAEEKLFITQEDFQTALRLVRPSAMREVLMEKPNTKWVDVGGLQLVKQEFKEAVEWPLKHPSAFKRLGIRPPRGLLMYGPPGCGKTLMAKAVAGESEANFIQIKGPELLNKWVGESLPYDEELIVKKEGFIKRIKIGEIVENKENVEILSFDKDKRVVFSKIEDYIKHKRTSDLLEITTRTGRKIKVTEDHSLFSFINGKLESIPTNYLIPDESFIAIPKRLNLPTERIENINLYNYFKNDDSIFVGNIKSHLVRAKKILGLKNLSLILKVSKKIIADIVYKNLPISIKNFDSLINKAKLAVDFSEITIKLKGSIHSYPVIFKLNKDFWRLVGLWVAEGDFNNYSVRITNSNPEIKEALKKICKTYEFSFTESDTMISINSPFFQKILRNILGLSSGAKVKRIPSLLFILDKESKSNFLRGYFSGDGSIYKAEREKFKIEADTISKELANDLLYLLLDFSIVATLYTKEERTGSITYRISILGVKNFENFRVIGFIDSLRNKHIEEYISSREWFRSDLIPLSGELYELASKNVNVGDSIGKERLKQVLIYLDKDKIKYREYWDLVEGDIFFDKIKEIKKVPDEEFVYDISVPDGQNFIAGFGGIFAHNSEKGVRKIFEKARQVSPSIIFFDEIDSLAPRRGSEGNNVTERIVNTLLAEMDGLEELNDVVVIAATNRPDILDPALLRPGRFDRFILIPPPEKESILEILKIHTKNMPLAKDVSLEKLALKMEGYVGADIESFVREAAILALRENIKASEVSMKNFEDALKKVHASVPKDTLEIYKSIENNYLKNAKAGLSKESLTYVG